MQASNAEREKFIFYRGVAHIDAPLKVSRDPNTGELLFRSQLEELPACKPLTIHSMWLVDIRPGGKIAFRTLPSVSLDKNSKRLLAHTPPDFESGDFSSDNLEKLKAALQTALVADGFFADEAQALLNTWELSYFKSTGLRVFFLVPRAWTDFYLPLQTTLPADINRVMVGRIELVTPEQRDDLLKISQFSSWRVGFDSARMQIAFHFSDASKQNGWEQLTSGRNPLSSSISVPETYQTYLNLGRFRNALILDEAKHHPAEGLTNFISKYRLQAFQPVESPAISAN